MADEEDTKNIEGEEEDAGGGSSKKMLYIIIAVVVLLVGGGAAAFFMMGGEEKTPEGEDAAKSSESSEESEESEEPEEEGVDPFYHSLGDAFVVNLPSGSKYKMMQVSIDVLTTQNSIVELLTKHDPLVRHKLFDLLGRQSQADLISRQGREGLAASIKTALEEILKDKGSSEELEGVYFNQFVLQ